MLKVFNKIELDDKLNKAKNKDILFLIFENNTNNEKYDFLPNYISNFKEQEEVVNFLSQKKTYSISQTLYLNLNKLYNNYSGNLSNNHKNEL